MTSKIFHQKLDLLTVFVETDVISLLSETLTADVQTVLSDQTTVRRTDTTLAGTFTESSWMREPNVFVSHLAIIYVSITVLLVYLEWWSLTKQCQSLEFVPSVFQNLRNSLDVLSIFISRLFHIR